MTATAATTARAKARKDILKVEVFEGRVVERSDRELYKRLSCFYTCTHLMSSHGTCETRKDRSRINQSKSDDRLLDEDRPFNAPREAEQTNRIQLTNKHLQATTERGLTDLDGKRMTEEAFLESDHFGTMLAGWLDDSELSSGRIHSIDSSIAWNDARHWVRFYSMPCACCATRKVPSSSI